MPTSARKRAIAALDVNTPKIGAFIFSPSKINRPFSVATQRLNANTDDTMPKSTIHHDPVTTEETFNRILVGVGNVPLRLAYIVSKRGTMNTNMPPAINTTIKPTITG